MHLAVVYRTMPMLIIMHNLQWNQLKFWKLFFLLFIPSDSCHKKMLLESLNIPLIDKNCAHHSITTKTSAHSHIQFTCVRLPVPANSCAVHALTCSNTLVRACEYPQTLKYYKGLGKHVLCMHACTSYMNHLRSNKIHIGNSQQNSWLAKVNKCTSLWSLDM